MAARWWIDDATGIVLWQETYDRSGSVDLSFGFTSVSVSHGESILRTSAAASWRSRGPALRSPSHPRPNSRPRDGPACGELAGLSLVRIRSDRASNPDMVHLVYSDGLNTVSVFQQRGQLTAAPEGSQWDAGAGSPCASWRLGCGDLAVR